jgi:UDP-N-acetylmuramate dehydrogenase
MSTDFDDPRLRQTWHRLSSDGVEVREDVELAPFTTLQCGGPARFMATARGGAALVALVRWARGRQLPVLLLGGGSNMVVSDAGFDGLVVRMLPAVTQPVEHADGTIEVDAGLDWDEVVQWTVDRGWWGLECLSGIPGRSGAAPVQNIGAYGAELAGAVQAVDVLDLQSLQERRLAGSELEFGYRTSALRTRWAGQLAVLRLHLKLSRVQVNPPAYDELVRELQTVGTPLTPALVRQVVLAIRARKSMVLNADDPNTRSVGSFFVNPVVSEELAARVRAAVAPAQPPAYVQPDGQVKLAAAWLIEAAGFRRGHIEGAAGLSERHALALINRGEATTAEVVRLAWRIHQAVRDQFGIRLMAEPVLAGRLPPELERAAAMFEYQLPGGA